MKRAWAVILGTVVIWASFWVGVLVVVGHFLKKFW